MKLRVEIRRKILQLVALGYSNPYVNNFVEGKISKGSWKQFCNPGMNCYSCPAASMACPVGSMQTVAKSTKFSFSFYAVGLVLAFGVLVGRFICGWLCPFGLIQELFDKVPLPKKRIPRPVKFVKWVLLILMLVLPAAIVNDFGMGEPFFCEFVCPVGTLEAGIPLLLTHESMQALIGNKFVLKVCVLGITVIACMVVYRFFCKVLCPLGALYGLLNKVSVLQLRVDPQACVNCGACARVCKMDVDPVKSPSSVECIRCGACAQACHQHAISISFVNKNKQAQTPAAPVAEKSA